MLDIKELYWAAGFVEGEGCFASSNGSPYICASQKQPESLFRLQKLLGGRIHYEKRWHGWRWALYGAAGSMMTLFSLMSAKRKAKIVEVLAFWRTSNGRVHRSHYKNYDQILAEYDNGARIFELVKKYNLRNRGLIHTWLKKRAMASKGAKDALPSNIKRNFSYGTLKH